MLKIVAAIVDTIFPVIPGNQVLLVPARTSGQRHNRQHRGWTPKDEVIWFNGFPGWPKLPLVQRLRASPSSSNPVVSTAPDEEEDGEEKVEEPEPLCRKQH